MKSFDLLMHNDHVIFQDGFSREAAVAQMTRESMVVFRLFDAFVIAGDVSGSMLHQLFVSLKNGLTIETSVPV